MAFHIDSASEPYGATAAQWAHAARTLGDAEGPMEAPAESAEDGAVVVYLAGPMTGIPGYNFPAFHAAAADLRARGYTVISPAEQDAELDGFDPWTMQAESMKHYMKRDLPAVLSSDIVAVLPGWASSKGARLEVHVADECGIPVMWAATGSAVSRWGR